MTGRGRRWRKTLTRFAVCTLLFGLSFSTEAQQAKKIHRIGVLVAGSSSSTTTPIEGFRQALHDLGYVEGKNIVIERRYGNGRQGQLPHLAAELVNLKSGVIVTTGTPPTVAVKNVTETIPVIFASVADPVNSGLVASLARPGGNITGFSTMNAGLSAKRLELLKETVPRVSRVAVIVAGSGLYSCCFVILGQSLMVK